ncbi:Zinc finger protein [Fasciola gigantica]|uniref:Zinc finger protein n=1 Tax=Fasciola gigantica TaxID=46835 RepID=A0A504Y6V7_FASGI|nr:Zinc finger protein [Fasciola gigantica]
MPRFKSTPRSILELQPDPGFLIPPPVPLTEPEKESGEPVALTSNDNATKPVTESVSDSSVPARNSESLPVPSVNDAECLGSLHAAALFAQAAALLAMRADHTFPVGNAYNPPIAPLGLSFFGLPNSTGNGQETPQHHNRGNALSFTSLSSGKGSVLPHGNGFLSRRNRPRVRHRGDPSTATRFPCWLPVNSTRVRTKLRLLAESENLNLTDLPDSPKGPVSVVPSVQCKKIKLPKQVSQTAKSAVSRRPPTSSRPSSSSPPPSTMEAPGPSSSDTPALGERQSKPSPPVQSLPTLSPSNVLLQESRSSPVPSSKIASPQKICRSSPSREPSESVPLPPSSAECSSPLTQNQKPLEAEVQPQSAEENHSSTEPSSPKNNDLTEPILSSPARRTRSSVARESGQVKSIPKPSPDSKSPPRPAKKALGFVECKICHKSLRQSSMNEHLARHDNSGKYKCATCGITFSRRSAQEKHERIHTGEKPFKCEHCPKAYRQMAHLRDHLRSHSGERPFVCRLCGFASGYKSLLRRHLRTHGVSNHPNAVPDLWYKTSGTKEEVMAVASEIGRKLESGQTLELGEGGRKLNPSERSEIELARHHLCTECPAGFLKHSEVIKLRLTVWYGSIGAGHVVRSLPQLVYVGNIQNKFTLCPFFASLLFASISTICSICSKPMSTLQRSELKDHMLAEHPNHQTSSATDPPATSPLSKRIRKRKPEEEEQRAVPECRTSPRLRDRSTDCVVMTWKRFCSVQTESSSPVKITETKTDTDTDTEVDQASNSSSMTTDSNHTDSCSIAKDKPEQKESHHHNHSSSATDEVKLISSTEPPVDPSPAS